jgi:hypothetical protein
MEIIEIDNILGNLDNFGENINTNKGLCIGFSNNQFPNIFWFNLNNDNYNNNNFNRKYICWGSYYGSSTCLGSTILSQKVQNESRLYNNLNIIVKHEGENILEVNFTPIQIENYIGDTGIETYYNKNKVLFTNNEYELGFTTRDLHRFDNHPVEISGCWLKYLN